MPTLLQISSVVNSGSVGRIAEQIGQTVIEQGWESYITYARYYLPSKSKTIKIGNKLDVYWHGINTRLFDNHGLCSTNATRRLIKQIDVIKPDIIQLHNIHGYYLNYKVLFEYLRAADIPVIWTLHDCWIFTGHCAHFTYIQCDRWKDACFNCPQKKTYPSSILFDRSKENFLDKKKSFSSIGDRLTIVPVSDWLSNLCAQSFFKNTSVKRIYNGVDTDIFKPISEADRIAVLKKYGITGTFLILGAANVWSARKGYDDFIYLRSLVSEDYDIFLVGLSKKQIRSLPPGIKGITKTEDIYELAKIYASADAFFNPSVEETFGLTTIEALSSGTPVIVYNSSACQELVAENTGFVVTAKDFPAIFDALSKIKQYGKSSYSASCRNHTLKYFRKEERYLEYFQLYEKLINKK